MSDGDTCYGWNGRGRFLTNENPPMFFTFPAILCSNFSFFRRRLKERDPCVVEENKGGGDVSGKAFLI